MKPKDGERVLQHLGLFAGDTVCGLCPHGLRPASSGCPVIPSSKQSNILLTSPAFVQVSQRLLMLL